MSKLLSNDRDSFDGDLQWFLIFGASAMRERGTLGAVVSMLEMGGASSGVPNTDLYNDEQVGFGRHVVGSIERYRWLRNAWDALDKSTQRVLQACYLAPRAEFRSDDGFGARDACPAVEEIKRGGVTEPQLGKHQSHRAGTESQLGRLAGLAFLMAKDPRKLLEACREPRTGKHPQIIAKATRDAKHWSKFAHMLWYAAKRGKPRKPAERRAVPRQYIPAEADQ